MQLVNAFLGVRSGLGPIRYATRRFEHELVFVCRVTSLDSKRFAKISPFALQETGEARPGGAALVPTGQSSAWRGRMKTKIESPNESHRNG